MKIEPRWLRWYFACFVGCLVGRQWDAAGVVAVLIYVAIFAAELIEGWRVHRHLWGYMRIRGWLIYGGEG